MNSSAISGENADAEFLLATTDLTITSDEVVLGAARQKYQKLLTNYFATPSLAA